MCVACSLLAPVLVSVCLCSQLLLAVARAGGVVMRPRSAASRCLARALSALCASLSLFLSVSYTCLACAHLLRIHVGPLSPCQQNRPSRQLSKRGAPALPFHKVVQRSALPRFRLDDPALQCVQ
eukprot:scaffold47_cov112-Isochrysis_galbana.AAC.6